MVGHGRRVSSGVSCKALSCVLWNDLRQQTRGLRLRSVLNTEREDMQLDSCSLAPAGFVERPWWWLIRRGCPMRVLGPRGGWLPPTVGDGMVRGGG